MDLLSDTSGGPNVLKVRGPVIAKILKGGNPGPVTFDVDSSVKDLRTMLAEAGSRGIELPLVARTLACFEEVGEQGSRRQGVLDPVGLLGEPQVTGTPRMKLYSFWRSLATFRVRIALNLKGITPGEVIDINLIKGQQREDGFRKVNPMMAIPALVEDDGTVLYESLAITEYLDEVHPQPPLLPSDPRGRARVRALAQIIACDAHPLVVPRVREFLEHQYKLDEPTRTEWCRHWSRQALGALETHLSSEKETGRYCHGDASRSPTSALRVT